MSNLHDGARMNPKTFPYFQYLLNLFKTEERSHQQSFRRHVHWGYWEDPKCALMSEEDFSKAQEQLTDEICTLADVQDGESVLDVGCGFGGTLLQLSERGEDLNLTGVNIDRKQLTYANQLTKSKEKHNITFIEGNACELPFKDNYFDKVLAVECIFHFPSRETFFKEVKRVLKPSGLFVISDYVSSRPFLPMAYMIDKPFFSRRNPFGNCNIRYTLQAYKRLSQKNGFLMQAVDVSRQVQPTYRFINQLFLNDYYTVMKASPLILPFAYAYELAAKIRLFRYYLIRFQNQKL